VNVSVMAMVRMRFLLAERGEYMASAFSFSPLPSEPPLYPRPAYFAI
jgi:hypothetical protein